MKTDTKTTDPGQQVRDASLQAALDGNTVGGAVAAAKDAKFDRKVSPRNGQPVPVGKGRAPGVKNRLISVRDAILTAFDMAGGPEYLYKLSQGTSSDRAAFTNLVAKVLPTQIQQEVSGGIQIQLSWLGQRSIGTVTAQAAEQITQVVDLQRDERGKYRIAEPSEASGDGEVKNPAGVDPPPPHQSGGGGGG